MKLVHRTIASLLAVVVTCLGSYAQSQPAQGTGIAFSLPYDCSQRGKNENARVACLADSFKPGRNVVLVGEKGCCSARTAMMFTDEHADYEFKATRLSITQECAAVGAAEENRGFFVGFYIAVVGADPAAVRVIPVKDDRSPVPKEVEQKARKLAARHIEKPRDSSDNSEYPVAISDAQPTVSRAENVTLLTFELQVTHESGAPIPWEPGPTVAVTNNGVFLLDGACTYGEPKFFSVNDKLHLTYDATVNCCGCGDTNFFVYDLSGESPKQVYQNSDFSD